MIIDFSVQNFGPIKDKQTLSFEADSSDLLEDYYVIKAGKFRLLKLALIYGANASGKTTILKAFDFISRLVKLPLNNKTQTLDFKPYLFDVKTAKQNSVISINFIANQTHYFYEVEFNTHCIEREVLDFYNPNKANVFSRTTDIKKQLSKISFGSKIKAAKTFEDVLIANTLWNNTVLAGFLKTNIDIPQIKQAADWFLFYLKFAVAPNEDLQEMVSSALDSTDLKKEDVTALLKKADFNIADIKLDKKDLNLFSEEELHSLRERTNFPTQVISILKNEKQIDLSFVHSVNGQEYSLPFTAESEGTKRYFGFAGMLLQLIKHSQCISVDELESSLHPDLYIHFLLTFLANAKQSQLIATTHNREILDNKDIFRNDAIWFTDKSATGATELYSLNDFDSSVVRNTSSVFNAYKAGKLGGVPNLGDYYIDLGE